MTDSYNSELLEAKGQIAALGLEPDDFSFVYRPLPPDSDNPGMFLVRYDVDVKAAALGYESSFSGGGGLNWVDELASDLSRRVSKQP